MKKHSIKFIIFTMIVASSASISLGQNTEFTYQGKLTDSGGSAATYDMQFRLCATESGACSPVIATYSQAGVAVSSSGIFTVKVVFTHGFDGSDRYLEIDVRRTGQASYTTLSPRQKITMAPYARYSVDTAYFNNLPLEEFVLQTDPRLDPNFNIRNTTVQQVGVNFNIGGTGTANEFTATTQYNIGADRVLSIAGSGNVFAGRNAGLNNSGDDNSFFGASAGIANTGASNSFFGRSSGVSNQSGTNNSFFGRSAGQTNTTGNFNTYFGSTAGFANSGGGNNTFFGYGSGFNSTGSSNTFIGNTAGDNNVAGSSNTIVGNNADVGSNNLSNASAIGAQALVTQSNSLVLGSVNGVNGSVVDTRVGIGTTAPANKLQIVDASNTGLRVQTNTTGGTVASFGGNGAFQIDAGSTVGGRVNVLENGNVGIGNPNPIYRLAVTGTDQGFSVDKSNAGGILARFGSNGNFRVDSAGTSGGRFSILENGNVGIGDNAPTAKVSIFQNTSPNPALSVVQASALGTGLSVVLSGGAGTALSVAGSGTASTALQVSNGAIRVPGAGIGSSTAVFVVERNVSNTCEEYLIIDNPYTNNDPNAILIVTAHLGTFSPFTGGASIFYVTSTATCPSGANKWWARPNVSGASFKLNVMVIKP